jgi:hypothetical protein
VVGEGAACEVYGALVERLIAKALGQMQHWTDIQLVWNREETSEVYGQRDDILADSRRSRGASRDIRLSDNTDVILRWLGFADS